MIIVSIYDCGYGFSVMVDNKIHKEHFLEIGSSKVIRSFKKAYYRIPIEKDFVRWIKRKYPRQDIIICEDGSITIYKTRRRFRVWRMSL